MQLERTAKQRSINSLLDKKMQFFTSITVLTYVKIWVQIEVGLLLELYGKREDSLIMACFIFTSILMDVMSPMSFASDLNI